MIRRFDRTRCALLRLLLVMAVGAAMLAPGPSHAQDAVQAAAEAVVAVRARIPPNARTAPALGTERAGSGVIIDDAGLILTIGYLILEASEVEIETHDGGRHAASIVAYDYGTGFGLLRALRPLRIDPLAFGDSDMLEEHDAAILASAGGAQAVIIVSRREFAGYWEYLLENAIFTGPPHPTFSGAALMDTQGRLLGIGSLIVSNASPAPVPLPGNMIVPINALKPVLADLLVHGRAGGAPRPWIGAFTEEARGRVFVSWLATDGPAARAGLGVGDIILSVADRPVTSMAEFFRALWAQGAAGTSVALRILKGTEVASITVKTGDRYDWLRLDPTY